jgi:hypothetical protein
MTQPFDDEHGERLRRALHAEAEAVTPSPEGLERIRSKINQRHERRLGFAYAAPWLRPFAAVAAALAVCLVAVSVTPALATFVQTGHFSPDSGSDGGKSTSNDGRHTGDQVPPSESKAPTPSASASPTAIHPSNNTGKHVVKGYSCPPGEQTVTPTSTPAPGAGATAKVTCQAPPGGSTSSPPVPEGPPTPPATTPPAPPSSEQPTSDSAPTGNQSP